MLDLIRVVLVSTSHPGNVGGVARAMKNMGLRDLVLVSPACDIDETAEARASGADDVLKNVKIVASMEEAVADCAVVIGASARNRHIPWPLMTPRQSAAKAIEATSHQNPVALVFGRESTGLTNEELTRCNAHLHIPSNPEYSSLNLVAAVQVVAYEMRLAALELSSNGLNVDGQSDFDVNTAENSPQRWGVPWDQSLASQEELEGFFEHLEETLVNIDFMDPKNPKHLMPRLRRVFLRSALDKTEVNIFRGILKMVNKAHP